MLYNMSSTEYYLVQVINHTVLVRRYFQHAHFIPIVGVGKRGEY